MNQVTCSTCNRKTDEFQWNEHLVSTNHLELCENNRDKTAMKFFQMIFYTYSSRSELKSFNFEKPLDSWEINFKTKLPREKFDTVC